MVDLTTRVLMQNYTDPVGIFSFSGKNLIPMDNFLHSRRKTPKDISREGWKNLRFLKNCE